MALGTTALAQTVAPAATPAANYTLESSTLKAPDASGLQVTAAPYALSGTSISGSSGSAKVILTAPVPENAAAYKMENGIYLYPTVFAGFGYNDNVQRTSNNVIGSNFINLAPQLLAEFKHSGDRYTVLTNVNRTIYTESSPDNTTNSEFQLAGDNYFSARARAGWSLDMVNGTDERGTFNRPVGAEPDRWHTSNLNARLIYGAPEAMGRVEVDLGNQVKTYDNNRAFTAVSDFTANSVAGRLFYRLGSRSLALAEVRQAQVDYASALAPDNNTERQYLLGVTWDATAATTGIVKVGRTTKDYDAANRQGYSGASWEASVRWLPRTYSLFELQTSRATTESSGVGTYDLNTTTSLSWKHNWTQSLSSEAVISNLNRTYGASTRSDSANTYSLAVDYSVLRWLKVGVDMANTDYSSNVPTAEYKRNIMMFTLNATL
jgi:hypothetical protein